MNFFVLLVESSCRAATPHQKGSTWLPMYLFIFHFYFSYLSLSFKENTQVIRVASQGWHRRLNKLTAPPAEEMSCIFFLFFPLLLPHSISTDISIGTRGKNSAGSRPKVMLNVTKKTQGNKRKNSPFYSIAFSH